MGPTDQADRDAADSEDHDNVALELMQEFADLWEQEDREARLLRQAAKRTQVAQGK